MALLRVVPQRSYGLGNRLYIDLASIAKTNFNLYSLNNSKLNLNAYL
jgi:hypothetical protein